jgi:pyruvate dehydrogenase E1 component alpha subunit
VHKASAEVVTHQRNSARPVSGTSLDASATDLLRAMLRIRVIEETLADRYREEEMRTPTHFSIGQEAVAVGVSSVLRPDDVVYSGHRCHAHYLAKGGDLFGMVAELYGREAGCAHGRGGSVHLNDASVGFVAASAILGQTMAVATGSAWAFKLDGLDRVAACYFGDGAAEEGIFHESLNFAAVKKVPVLFVCENNLYSTHTSLAVRQPPGITIWERAGCYQMPSRHVDGNDVFAVQSAAREAIAHLRAGRGPYFLELSTYRWREHVGPNWDYDAGYRTKQEVESWTEQCPIKRAVAVCEAAGLVTPAVVDTWHRDVECEIARVVDLARAAPFPRVQHLLDGTYEL